MLKKSPVVFLVFFAVGLPVAQSAGQSSVLYDVTIYWTDLSADKIQRVNVGSGVVEDLVTFGLNTPVAIALDVEGGKMYWTDQQTHEVRRANLDGSSSQRIRINVQTHPLGIAVDPSAGKVYWTEWCDEGNCSTSSILRANLDGSARETLVETQGAMPRGIALDPGSGKMYWWDAGMMRANTDGSDIEQIPVVASGLPWDLVLDVDAGHVYWSAKQTGSINRADLDGSNQQILDVGTGREGIDLDLINRKVYWTAGTSIYRANLDFTNVEVVQDSLQSATGIALIVQPAIPTMSARSVAVSSVLFALIGITVVCGTGRRRLSSPM